MLIKYLSTSLVALTIGLTSTETNAVAPLSSQQLSELCADYKTQPTTKESVQCARYIKGFIDGAIAVDADIAKSQADAKRSISSFKERAIKNRIGNRVTHLTLDDKSFGEFCLGKPITISDVIKTVASEINTPHYQDQSALTAMQGVLKQNYPCSTS